MSEQPLISIVVPVYNVEMYLKKCIESIMRQTYTNLEIILVDDGSTDKSGKICDDYSRKDNRIQVIHKVNGGVSSARNLGLNIFSGEYISFVDGDDYVSELYIENLFKLIKSTNTKLSITNFKVVENNSCKIRYLYTVNGTISSELLIKMILNFEICSSVWGKLYHKTLVEKLRFDNYNLGEDLLFIIQILLNIDILSITDECTYFYIIRKTGAINSDFSYSKYLSLKIYDKLVCLLNEKYYELAVGRLLSGYFNVLFQLPNIYVQERQNICSKIRYYRKIAIKNKNIRKKTRLACFLSYLGFHVLKQIFFLVKKYKFYLILISKGKLYR